MIDRDKDGFYTSTLEAIIKFGGEEKHNFKECMTEFIETFLRHNPNSRKSPCKSPRKSCLIKDDEIDEFLWNGIARDIVTDSFAVTGDVSTERDVIIQNVDEGCKNLEATKNCKRWC